MRCFTSLLALCLVVVTCQTSFAETTSPARVPAVSEIGKSLGPQVTRAMMMRSDVAVNNEGRHVSYTVLMGQPAMLVATDVLTAQVLKTYPLPSTSGAWSVMATEDSVYVGAYNQGLMYRLDLKTDEVKNLGHPLPAKDVMLYPTVEANGKIYGGAYSSGHAFELDPATNQFRDLGQVTTTTAHEKWIRVTAHDPKTNKLFFGIGNEPQLVEYDLATGNKRDLLPKEYADITSVYDLTIEGGRAFCRKETNNPYENFVLEIATGKTIPVKNADTGETGLTFINASRGLSPKSPIANKLYYVALNRDFCEYDLDTNTIKSLGIHWPSVATGYRWVELKDAEWPGWTLVGTLGNTGQLYRYNPQTGKNDVREIAYPGQPINIHDIEAGPDGKIYSGGYLAGNMGVYDPATSKTTHLSGSGQTEGLVFLGKKLYMGVYPNGRVFEYDTEKPWTGAQPMFIKQVKGSNPDEIFSLEYNKDIPGYTNQDRPFAMAAAEDLQKLIVGTVPKNGMLGGALAVWDAKERGEPEVYWNIVPDQSIVSLVYRDGVAYGGTSIYGGLGAKEPAKEAQLFAWDVARKKMLYSIPMPGEPAITQLLVRPDGNIWGLAGGELFVFDPAKREITGRVEAVTGAGAKWREGSLINGVDGNVYGTMGYKLFRVNPETMEVTIMANGADKVATDKDGRLYTYGSPKTILYQIEP
jgi:streptogramin lyase